MNRERAKVEEQRTETLHFRPEKDDVVVFMLGTSHRVSSIVPQWG